MAENNNTEVADVRTVRPSSYVTKLTKEIRDGKWNGKELTIETFVCGIELRRALAEAILSNPELKIVTFQEVCDGFLTEEIKVFKDKGIKGSKELRIKEIEEDKKIELIEVCKGVEGLKLETATDQDQSDYTSNSTGNIQAEVEELVLESENALLPIAQLQVPELTINCPETSISRKPSRPELDHPEGSGIAEMLHHSSERPPVKSQSTRRNDQQDDCFLSKSTDRKLRDLFRRDRTLFINVSLLTIDEPGKSISSNEFTVDDYETFMDRLENENQENWLKVLYYAIESYAQNEGILKEFKMEKDEDFKRDWSSSDGLKRRMWMRDVANIILKDAPTLDEFDSHGLVKNIRSNSYADNLLRCVQALQANYVSKESVEVLRTFVEEELKEKTTHRKMREFLRKITHDRNGLWLVS